MANMNFGVNLLPKQNNTYSLGNSDKKWNLYVNTINGETLDELIPEMVGATSGSDGSGGMVPAPTDGDTDKFLRGDGTWSEPNVNVWDEMTLNKTEATFPTNDVYVIGGETLITNNRVQYKVSNTPATGIIPKYDTATYLRAGTPPAGDNSEKVATTSFVSTALEGIGGIQINKSTTLPSKTVPINDGYEIYPIQQMILSIEHTQNLNGQIQPWIGGSYINLVNVTDFTATETTVKTIGTLAANTYILSFYVNSTTTVGENETTAGGSAIIKADDTVLDTLTIDANNNERKIFSFTLESSATITLTISGDDTTYSYVVSKIQLETNAQVSNYTPYENLCPITAGYTQCEVLHRAQNLWDSTSPIRVPGYYNNDGTFTQAENWRPISISCVEGDVITIYGSHFKDVITLWNDNTFVDYTTNTTITIPEGVNKIIVCGLNTTAEDQIYCNEYTYVYEFPQVAGTVYGGQLTLTPDGAGVLTSNFNIGNLSSLTWTYDNTNDVFVADCFVDQKLPASNMFKGVAYCSNLPVIAASSVLAGNLGLGITSDGKYYVHYRGMGTDATAFTATMTDQTIYYETATTSTYNMSSLEVITSFPGYNSFTSNTGTIRRIDYVANTTGMINTADKLKLNALDLDTQASVNHDVTLKADKVSGATNGNFAALNASGNLVDSGHKHSDYLTSFTETDPTVPAWAKVTTPPYYTKPSSGIPATDLEETYLTAHQDISGKANSADLAAVATSGDYDDLSNTPEEIDPYKVVSTPADIITIQDGADGLPMGLKVGIEPVQDLHGYENPWPAGGGANKYNISAANPTANSGVTAVINSDKCSITLNGTATIDGSVNVSIVNDSSLPYADYYYHCDYGANTRLLMLKRTGGQSRWINSGSVVTVGETDYPGYAFVGFSTGDVFNNTVIKFQLNNPSSVTTWQPYSNICPISGWDSANVGVAEHYSPLRPDFANEYTHNGVTFDVKNYPFIDVKGTAAGGTAYSGTIGATLAAFKLPAGTHTLKAIGDISSVNIVVQFGSGSGVSNANLTSDNPAVTFTFADEYGVGWYLNVQNGSTADAHFALVYEEGQVYEYAFPQAAKPVYGGTLTIHQDGTGELVVDMANVDLGTLTWSAYSASLGAFVTPLEEMKNNTLNSLCSQYVVVKNYVEWSAGNRVFYKDTNGKLHLKDSAYANYSVSDFKTAMSGVQLVYELSTPVTYTLTPGQVKTLLDVNNIWADTGEINRLEYPYETTGLIGTHDKVKLDLLPSSILSGINLASTALTPVNGIVTIPLMTGCDASNNGAAGAVPAPSSGDQDKFLAGDGTWKDGGKPMVILSYGNSTWNDFITAYNNNVIVYCRASSNSNPGSGSQTRMAFMAYVNDATNPTNVEFQYYRSMNAHSATQMGDQVFIYKLDKTSGWSVTTREASIKEINVASGSKLGVSWSSNKVTLSNTMTADDMPMSSSDATTTKSAIDELNSNLTNMEAKTITGKTPTTLNTLKDFPLPSGFTANNCTLIGYCVQNANNSEWYSSASNVDAYLYSNGLRIQIKDSTWLNMDFKALVMHFPT